MLLLKTDGLGAELGDGERRSIVQIDGRVLQGVDLAVQNLPLIRCQTSVTQFVTRNLAHA